MVLVPCDETVKTPFAASLVTMLDRTYRNPPASLGGLYINMLGTTILPQGRQTLAEHALRLYDSTITHLLWIDSDMKFPHDTLMRMLRRDEKLVGANYPTRRPPHKPTAHYDDGSPVHTTPDSSGLERVDRMGFGLLWMAREVIAEMEPPFFDYQYRGPGLDWGGEDSYFFAKAQALGFEAYVDHDLSKEVQHVGNHGFGSSLLVGQGGNA